MKLVQSCPDPRPIVVIAFMCDPARLKSLFPHAIIFNGPVDSTPWPALLSIASAQASGPLGPVAALGWSAGGLHLRNLWAAGARPQAIGVFDGTHTSWPPKPEQDAAWSQMFADGRDATRLVCVSHIFQTYTERIPVGKPGRASATVTTLRRVLGWELPERPEPYTTQDGSLYVSSWPSTDCDAVAHSRQLNEALPEMCRQFVAPYLGGMRGAMLRVDDAGKPELTYGERMVAWSLAEMAANVGEEPPGSNTGRRIREYLAPCERNGRLLGLRWGAWCAAAACAAARAVARPGDLVLPYRAAGLDMMGDLEAAGRLHPKGSAYTPKIGDLAFYLRPGGPAWGRHVTRLKTPVVDGNFDTIAGNEAGRWRVTSRSVADPLLVAFGEV